MTVEQLVYFLLIGLLAGWAAAEVMRGRGFGLIGNIVVGIIGAVIGGWLVDLLNIQTGGSIIWSLITAFFGAVILLALVGAVRGRRRAW